MLKKQTLILIMGSLLLSLKATQVLYGQTKIAKTDLEIFKIEEAQKIKKLIAAVEKNPDDMKAHEDYINAMNIYTPEFENRYALWIKRFPKSAIVPFELGKTYEEHTDPRCTENLRKALKLNPNLAEAWQYLSYYATFVGDKSIAIEYMQRATQADPQNAAIAFKYAFLFKNGDQAKYDSLLVDVAHRFPDSEKGIEALWYLANISFNKNEKTAYYEAVYRMYSKQQSSWFRSVMADYYDYLLNTTPDKAFDLALRMVLEIKINRGYWKKRLNVARGFVEADKLLEKNKPDEAADMLKHVNLGNSKVNGTMIDAEETLALFKAKAADASNKTRDAYDSLAVYYSKQPTDRIYQTIRTYASKLHIDSAKIDTDIWNIRNKQAWDAGNFTLENFADHKPVSLSDYRGRIVLLTYWFPSCGPCRDEFLHFEAILKKYNTENIAYVAINVSSQEDDYVLPLVKKMGYTFVPLRNDQNKKTGNLPDAAHTGAPTNFLIDGRGRVIFSDFKITDENVHTLELMIAELCNMGTVQKDERGIKRE